MSSSLYPVVHFTPSYPIFLCTCIAGKDTPGSAGPGGGVLYIFWVRGRAIGKGIDFHDFGIRNGIDFHDFGIRNGIDFHNFQNWYIIGSGMHFRKFGIKSGICF